MYNLKILTPETVYFDDQVISIIAPGGLGYLGILTDHTPLVTTLKHGYLIVTDKQNKKHFYEIEGVVLTVAHNEVNLLVEKIEPSDPSKLNHFVGD